MLGMLGLFRVLLYMLALPSRSLGEEWNGARSLIDNASQTRRLPPPQGLDRAGAVAADTNALRLALHTFLAHCPEHGLLTLVSASARQDHAIGRQQVIGIANI